MAQVLPEELIPRIERKQAVLLQKRQSTGLLDKFNKFRKIDIDVIKHDKWYYTNLILMVLSFIVAVAIAEYYPPCNPIPTWVHGIKYAIYSLTFFVWVNIQIGIYRHHHPLKPDFVSIITK